MIRKERLLWLALCFLVVGPAGCGSDMGGTGGTSGGGHIGPPPPGGFGDPIMATDMQWTFVPFATAFCMDNTATGIGVNFNSGSDKVMIYLEGGGACFNTASCSQVAHPNGFGEADLASAVTTFGDLGVFNRRDPANPFKDWNHVFIPYCSGDIFGGNAMSGFGGRVQIGYKNLGEFLKRIVPTFAHASQVALVGSSAGGFGAAVNFDRAQTWFGTIPVTLIDDSGPPMRDMYLTPCLQQETRDIWKIGDSLPADCAACNGPDGGGFANLAPYLGRKYPNNRFALVASKQDAIIRFFYGFGYPTCSSTPMQMDPGVYQMGIEDFKTNVIAPYANFKGYLVQSMQHVWLLDLLDDTTVNGEKLTAWLSALIGNGSGWDTVDQP